MILYIIIIIIILIAVGISIYYLYKNINNTNGKFNKKEIHEALYKMLYKIDKRFRKENIDYVVSCGTLLGAIRENKMIDHDFDVDLDAYEDQIELIEKVLRDICQKEGYSLHKHYIGFKIGYSNYNINNHTGAWVDIYIRNRENEDVCFINKRTSREYPKEAIVQKQWIFPIKRCNFGKIKVNIPNNPIPIIKQFYGDDWKTPKDYNPGRLRD